MKVLARAVLELLGRPPRLVARGTRMIYRTSNPSEPHVKIPFNVAKLSSQAAWSPSCAGAIALVLCGLTTFCVMRIGLNGPYV